MRTLGKIVAAQLVLLAAFERVASACPFCGGKGASGLLENLLLVAALWFGVRGMMRAWEDVRSAMRVTIRRRPR